MPLILDGKKVAQALYEKILLDLSLLPNIPKIVFVLIGDDAASQTYVQSKTKKCLDLGLRSETLRLSAQVTEDELLTRIKNLNADSDVQGILIQLPLPAHLNKLKVLRQISPLKDVDGLHPDNVGRLCQGAPRFVPCTPAGIMEMLKFYGIHVQGKKAVVLGRSEIVGKPMAQLLVGANATVTVCHSKTRNLAEETRSADILIAALGKSKFIGADFVKPGSVVIDVGIHRVDGKLVGDVDFDSVAPVVHAISPVPGGVGPMTIAMLMKNLAQAATLNGQRGLLS